MGSPNWSELAKRGVFPDGIHPVDKILDARDDFSSLEGVGKATVAKLIKADVKTIQELKDLSNVDLEEYVGITMAGKIRKALKQD